jgi:hypothetical protein
VSPSSNHTNERGSIQIDPSQSMMSEMSSDYICLVSIGLPLANGDV